MASTLSTTSKSSTTLTTWFLKWATPVILMSLLTALAAQAKFYLPFTPVPITLQSLVVILSGAWFGMNRGAASQVLLAVLCAFQVPVYSQAGALFGPTGGYILGFVFAAMAAGFLRDRGWLKKNGFLMSSLLLFAASMFIFIPGVIWLKVWTGRTFYEALAMGFFPFLIGDVVKTLTAALAVKWIGSSSSR